MCGRFYVDDEMLNEIHKICKRIDENYQHRTGDVRPSETALIIRKDNVNELGAISCIWGYQMKDRKQLLINARLETIHQKYTFRDDYKHHRCVIPVSGFYEWDQYKEKYRCIPQQNKKVLYLAGIYSGPEQDSRFTIITAKANEIMRTVHDRMPVILQEEKLYDWLEDKDKISNQDIPFFQLQRENNGEGYQQINLF